jgi:hypothetical protein
MCNKDRSSVRDDGLWNTVMVNNMCQGNHVALTLRQVSHLVTYLVISHFILVQQKFFFKSWYILLVPRWIEYLEQWALSIIL